MKNKIYLTIVAGCLVGFDLISYGKMDEQIPVVISGLGVGICLGLLLSYYIIKKYNLILVNPFKDFTWKWFASVGIIGLIIFSVFIDTFVPRLILFSNDGPLGVMNSDTYKDYSIGSSRWVDLNWIGSHGGITPITLTSIITYILGPVYYSKFYVPLVLWFSSICGVIYFRTLNLSYSFATVASVAICLNVNFLSNASWGVGSRSVVLGFMFLALSLVHTTRGVPIIRNILAGICIGMTICEGADNGVIMSLFFALYFLLYNFIPHNCVWFDKQKTNKTKQSKV